MAELTVSAGLARGLVNLAAVKGADRAMLLARAGIGEDDLANQDNRIALANYVALMRAGKELANDPALALHYGETSDFAEVSVVGLIGNASETMAEALQQLNRYGRLVIEFDGGPNRFATERAGPDSYWLIDIRENPNDFPELTESTFARMICGPRLLGVPQLARAVHVTHARPGYANEVERVFGAAVTYNAARNAMLIDNKWTNHRIQTQPRYAFGVLSKHAGALLRELEASKSVHGKVEALLMPVLHKGDASMDAIAEKLAMSRQTLFRRLKDEGTTFEKVLDELRRKLALDYLGAKKVSVNETAYLVGFSDPAAFSRAFKRWTGKNPRDMRAGE
ncbi:MAG: AraC family transcriptional regulator [Proteobacteria bacterium]|nr:AraC family transcriptional regulator [Pseudomonadota bacterium]